MQDFFERKVDADGYERVIRQFDTERFKPLCNFLKRRTNNTDEINIELLAWLIDFQPRPYYTDWTPLAPDESHNTEVTDRLVSFGGKHEDAVTASLKRKRLVLFAGLALSGVLAA
ncbi:hypothetical protein BDE36_3573 [Arcticibacter tournemirensis]|uniref:Uncharacterized protein n=1 Tax=Arcticibacter tournemirensis TaxID=699437 RepID=A0A5M9HBI2_9SPHI|nr:hypothetical protein [Arcticibacter tournemirensis]KAA8484050.1 hypothetical protein F1649_06805 [Arcticibacter tournemirensis]TQM51783.1 hypothetical protein BDE36_3573 [Arcticibacter tournemirensis]